MLLALFDACAMYYGRLESVLPDVESLFTARC